MRTECEHCIFVDVCGGFSIYNLSDKRLQHILGNDEIRLPHKVYNARPLMLLPVLKTLEDGQIKSVSATWGIKTDWASSVLINAKIENRDNRFWGSLLPCLIPANGFFEWKKSAGKSVPYYFKDKKRDLFFMAGLFKNRAGEKGYSFPEFVVVTRPASKSVINVHSRMPLIIEEGDEKKWLLGKTVRPTKELASHEVSKDVNVASNNSETLLYPLKAQDK